MWEGKSKIYCVKNIDYIIVGDGYAALFFAHQLIKNKHSFVLFSEGKKSASMVSAGIINPVVLKKFTTFWKALEQIDGLKNTLSEIEQYTGKNYFINENIHRIFHDDKEKELWMKKSKDEALSPFLSTEFEALDGIKNPFKTGKVLHSGRLNVEGFFTDMLVYLNNQNHLIQEQFDYSQLNFENNSYNYKDISFKNIVFAEGMGVKENPFFSEIPVNPNKGHHIKVKLAKELNHHCTIKKKHFLFPYDEKTYYYGGTYDREQTHCEVDEAAIQQLKNGLSEVYKNDFEVVDTQLGFRPTVKDRRPILGAHHQFRNLFVFNGLGARGILNGCYFSEVLYQHIENQKPLPEEVDLDRFKVLGFKSNV